uniref:Uncharacterized protein n=1 Tax=Glossina austeni TaxID=7395 RepID=A0A1A9UHT2_GLOAU
MVLVQAGSQFPKPLEEFDDDPIGYKLTSKGLLLLQELQDAGDGYIRDANCATCRDEKQAPQPKLKTKGMARRQRIVEKRAEKKKFVEK